MNKNKTLLAALFLGIVSFVWLLYDVYQINHDLIGALSIESIGMYMAIGYPFILLFNLVSFWVLLRHTGDTAESWLIQPIPPVSRHRFALFDHGGKGDVR